MVLPPGSGRGARRAISAANQDAANGRLTAPNRRPPRRRCPPLCATDHGGPRVGRDRQGILPGAKTRTAAGGRRTRCFGKNHACAAMKLLH